jgi:hypothetical protein
LCHLNMMGFKEILYYDKQEAHHSLVAWAWNNFVVWFI